MTVLQCSQWDNQNTEYCFRLPGANSAVVFIHGILEGPDQFRDFVILAKQNYAVYNLLLPGHAKDDKAFANSSMHQWRAHVAQCIRTCQQTYDRIILVGHSMGALLAMEYAALFPKKIAGLFLLAVPLCIRLTSVGFCNGLKVAFGRIKAGDTLALAARKACTVQSTALWRYATWIPRYIELFLLSAAVRKKILPKLSLPIVVIQSNKDEFVSLRSQRYLRKNKAIHCNCLALSGHYYYLPEERKWVLEQFCTFLKKYA